MKLDHFNNLSEDEQAAYLLSCEAMETTIKDNEAEIKSLKSELETVNNVTQKLEKDLQDTKELNFTLARSIDTSKDRPTFEDTLHECFMRKEK